MAAQNWMKSLPTTCFAIYGYPEASSDGFRGVSEGSETVWFQKGFQRGLKPCEGFQRGLKPCGFRGVSEGSETVWFQRGLKPCGFRGVSEGSETAWFQRGFRGV